MRETQLADDGAGQLALEHLLAHGLVRLHRVVDVVEVRQTLVRVIINLSPQLAAQLSMNRDWL